METKANREILTERGKATLEALTGREPDVAPMIGRTDEEWATLMYDYVVNGMYSRGILPHKVRELCAVAALTVLQRTPQLEAHLRMALRFNSVEEVREVILQMSVYGGMPVTLTTLDLLEKIQAEEEAAS